MIAIRGATTVAKDDPEEIRKATGELLGEIVKRNKLEKEGILFILFSTTSDIRSLYPAAAARECGFTDCALYSSLEPDMNQSLKLCIRVMIMSDIELCKNRVSHVYLRGAADLRKDLAHYAVALDGPAGSGKSTIAKLLAKEKDILYLDTGAMYRACALQAKREGRDVGDAAGVEKMLSSLRLDVVYEDGAQKTLLSGEDVSGLIRTPEISMAASRISALPAVRMKMVEMQREIASRTSCVLDGRDIGSFVLPDAKYKFFLTATSSVRAKRRYEELIARGEKVEFESLKREIEQRDEQDRTRDFAPLVRAKDAVLVDTSDKNIREVLQEILCYME